MEETANVVEFWRGNNRKAAIWKPEDMEV